MLAESDVITIHIHLLPENLHLFNAETFAGMKDGARLVNTSRGDIIDETALIDALESGKLASYGTDVIHNEWRNNMLDSSLVQYAAAHENVIILPHLGGGRNKTAEARVFSAKKLIHFIETGKELKWPRGEVSG